jgi:hypothetical protein
MEFETLCLKSCDNADRDKGIHKVGVVILLYLLHGLVCDRLLDNAVLAHCVSCPGLHRISMQLVEIGLFLLTSAYKPIFSTPIVFNPSHSTPAVIPLPQLVTTVRSPACAWRVNSGPRTSNTSVSSSSGERSVVNLSDEPGTSCD